MPPRKIVILRHGEKPGDSNSPDTAAEPDLSSEGVVRAKSLATVIPEDFGAPDFLVAAASSDKSYRPVETLQPLATKLQFNDDRFVQSFANEDYERLAGELVNKSKYASKLVIVCWHHGNIPQLARALGVTPAQMVTAPEYNLEKDKWNSAVFDRFWILDYAAPAGVAFQSVAQNIVV